MLLCQTWVLFASHSKASLLTPGSVELGHSKNAEVWKQMRLESRVRVSSCRVFGVSGKSADFTLGTVDSH